MTKLGRPTDYSTDLAAEICAQLSMGMSVRTVCKAEDMPAASTVFKWLASRPDFVEQYTRAKEESADAHAEDILDISDDGTNDWMEQFNSEGESVGWRVNGENIQRSRLRVDTRKWLASKLKSKKYGDRIQQEVSGKDGGAIQFETKSTEQLTDQLVKLVADYPELGEKLQKLKR